MNGFEKRASLIKEKIKQATLELLRTLEPGRIRIVDISKAAKVSQVTIYNYFGSKEGLLQEVFKDYLNRSIQEFEDYLREEHTLREKIEHILLQKRRALKDNLSVDVIKEMMINDQEMYRYVEEEYQSRAIPLIIKLIEDGKAAGEISSKVSVQNVLIFINMFVNQSVQLLQLAEHAGNIEKLTEDMVEMFFYGVCGRPET